MFGMELEPILWRLQEGGEPQLISGRHEHSRRLFSALRRLFGRNVRDREEKKRSLSFRIFKYKQRYAVR